MKSMKTATADTNTETLTRLLREALNARTSGDYDTLRTLDKQIAKIMKARRAAR